LIQTADRRRRRHGCASRKPLGVRGVGDGEDAGAIGDALVGEPVVDVVWREQADTAVAVLAVVPAEEWTAVRSHMLP
jgi:hypothetical protein